MFVGHYAASFVVKSYLKEAPLGLLFLGAQLVDIIFFPLALFNIEQLRISPHFTASTNFELPFMPYTHSLVATLIWSLIAYGVVWICGRKQFQYPHRVAIAMAICVASHWFCDLLVHTPDLPLFWNNSVKFGFGIWRNAPETFFLEAGLLSIGMWMYYRSSQARNRLGRYGILIFAVVLTISNAVNIFGPPVGDSVPPFVAVALSSYFGFALIAWWLEKNRIPLKE